VIDGLARVMCMSEYLDREFLTVPRLPLLTECAPLAAAVAGAPTGRRPAPTSRCTDTAAPSTDRDESSGSSSQRPSWRFVRLRLGKTGQPVVEDRQRVEMTADDVANTCGPTTVAGESSRATTDSEVDADLRRCDNEHLEQRQRRPAASSTATADRTTSGGGGSGRSKLSRLENDVREVRRILQAYALRLNERDAHARVTKQWRLVARVLDRLFFFFYCATILISLATIFPR